MRVHFVRGVIDRLRGKKRVLPGSRLPTNRKMKTISDFFTRSQKTSKLKSKEYLELVEEIKLLQPDNSCGDSAASKEWNTNFLKLKNLILNDDIDNFLNWDVIRYTMFAGNAEYISRELDAVKTSDPKYIEAIREDIVGNPEPSDFHVAASSNLIHHVYSILQYETKSFTNVKDVDFVFEFGGGYGSMCRAFYNLGFTNKYVIFDLPAFSLLQKYFLKTIGLPVINLESFIGGQNGILCLSDMAELNRAISAFDAGSKKMFLGTWSISETSLRLRAQIEPLLNAMGSFLIAYQEKFHEVDNVEYFKNFANKRADIKWMDYPIIHLNGSRYLIGKRGDS